ncbi:MAG: hypothetical protein V4651_13700 [Bacteroidota bacterium]
MSTFSTPEKKEEVTSPATENSKVIENHKTAAKHHEEASKHHVEAVKHHENGDTEKAAHSTVVAQGHSNIANKAQKNVLKHHTISKS